MPIDTMYRQLYWRASFYKAVSVPTYQPRLNPATLSPPFASQIPTLSLSNLWQNWYNVLS